MKKITALLLAGLLLLSACSLQPDNRQTEGTQTDTVQTQAVTTEAPSASGSTEEVTQTETAAPQKEIIVWALSYEEEIVKKHCAAFLSANPQYAETVLISVKPVRAEDLISRMNEATDTSLEEGVLPDIEEMPDLFYFYSDDFDQLQKAGLLSRIPDKTAENIRNNTEASAIAAAQAEEALYAYPSGLEHTLLLYYDTSRIEEHTDFSKIAAACEEADHCFTMGSENTLFPALIFSSFGLHYQTEIGADGKVSSVACDYYTEKGLEAAKMIRSLLSESNFLMVEGSPVITFSYDQARSAAVIADSYQTAEIKMLLGDNYAAAPLPVVTTEDGEIPLASPGTFILIGVAPKKDQERIAICHELADYLNAEDKQLSRYKSEGTIPVNSKALKNRALKNDETASALVAQMPYVTRRVVVTDGYYSAMNSFTDKLLQGEDEMQNAKIQQLLDELSAFLMADVAKAQE